jgi:hypothetical protein
VGVGMSGSGDEWGVVDVDNIIIPFTTDQVRKCKRTE